MSLRTKQTISISTLQDVRVKRAADVASDLHLLIAKLRMKLKKYHKTDKARKRYKMVQLEDPEIAQNFKLNLSNILQVLQELYEEDTPDVDTMWNNAKEIWNRSCEDVVGFMKLQHKEWTTPETLKTTEQEWQR